jgi:hypothetical protein
MDEQEEKQIGAKRNLLIGDIQNQKEYKCTVLNAVNKIRIMPNFVAPVVLH